ncbi:DUF3027 family protein [Microcella putealis]|uniref:DUF3027 family protein n=1 Tax=Microcella putealis TaxID=337005 RepID=A0A4Q7LI71_9MICO|nr:DUF3027 domain-containing protein [Microcella putealis]RZS53457.1 DUF3027 family protein [Microcella putealis]TQM26901.1 DUF3027 family protein [Microcella putealis]
MPDAPGKDTLEALGRSALAEVTPERTVGQLREVDTSTDGVVTLTYSTTMGGYPGWVWTVAVSTIDPANPSVLETELMPGDGALLAPDWVPWADRLDEYIAQQAELAAAGADDESDDDADDDDSDDDDADEHDLHDDHDADVFDGVDIDAHADEGVSVDADD